MKLSVSIITYNHQDYIEQAILSVVNQHTNFDFEILVADDCSTDETPKIIEKLAKEYKNIRVIKRINNIGMVRNALETISLCKGEYIALLEGDDFWVDIEKLQKQVNYLDQNDDVVFCFTNGYFLSDLYAKEDGLFYKGNIEFPSKFDLNYLINNNFFIHCNTKIFRRSTQPISFPESIYSAPSWDWALSLMQAEKGNIAYLDIISLAYRRHENAQINYKNREEILKEWVSIIK